MTRADALQQAEQQLKAAHIDEATREARLLVAEALGIPRLELVTKPETAISVVEEKIFHEILKRRVAREPLARIIGRKAFWKQEYVLNESTLEPRPETETLIEAVLAAYPDRTQPLRILDIGTGTGCILITLLHEYPTAMGTGVDISKRALEAARINAAACDVAPRATFKEASWGRGVPGSFDIIVSNPPYITRAEIETLQPEVKLHDPLVALDGGLDGLEAYRKIMGLVRALLANHGKIFLEIGRGQEKAVKALCAAAKLKDITEKNDLAGIVRVISAAI